MKETHWTTDVDPQTKAATYGISSLTDAELLALVIRNGTKEKNALDLAAEVLAGREGFYSLMESDKEDFLAIEGIGQAKAYLCIKQEDGTAEDIPSQITQSLVEMGWLACDCP